MSTDAEQLGEFLLKTGWPKSKEEAATCKAKVEQTQSAIEHAAKLKAVDKLAAELRIIGKMGFVGQERQDYQIREVIRKLQEAMK